MMQMKRIKGDKSGWVLHLTGPLQSVGPKGFRKLHAKKFLALNLKFILQLSVFQSAINRWLVFCAGSSVCLC